ncbi:serine/arginine-rich splicing factor 2-like, partial [Varroa destructor]
MSRSSRGPPNIHGMVSLKVDNLTYRTTIEDLKRVFRKYGDVGDVYIPRNPRNNESRGFAFVRFYSRRDAEEAMDCLDGYRLDGRELRIAMAKYARPGGRGGRERSRSRDRHRRRSRTRSRSRDRRSRSRSHRRRSRSDSRSRRSTSKDDDRHDRKSRSRDRDASIDRDRDNDRDRSRERSRDRDDSRDRD